MARNRKINWKKQLELLEEYAASKKWSVIYRAKAKNDWADWARKSVRLKERTNKEELFYVFLHELGHMLMFQNNRAYSSKYEAVFDEFTGGTQPVSIARIEEELEAWRTGLRLCFRLNLKVNRRNYEKVKSKYAMTYIAWASRRTSKKAQAPAEPDRPTSSLVVIPSTNHIAITPVKLPLPKEFTNESPPNHPESF